MLHTVFDTSLHICEHTRCRVCKCARVCAACPLLFGDESVRVQLVYSGHLLLGVGCCFDRGRDRGVVCVFSILIGVAVYVGVCICIRTHTRTLDVGYLEVGTRHLEGLSNPNGLNLGIYAFVYVYEIRMCID